jgi:predicted DNA-binding transcriptional regulator AlpA
MTKQDSDLITIQQAIKEFSVSRMTLIRALDAGQLDRYRRGGDRNVYVSRSAIKAWRTFRKEGK